MKEKRGKKKGKERKRKERKGKERKGKEKRKRGKGRKRGKERKREEKRGKERKGKGRKSEGKRGKCESKGYFLEFCQNIKKDEYKQKWNEYLGLVNFGGVFLGLRNEQVELHLNF